MNIKGLLAILGIAYVLRSAGSAATNAVLDKIDVLSIMASNFRVQVGSIVINSTLSFDIDMKIQNRTPVNANINSITGNIFYNNVPIVPVNLTDTVALSASSTQTLPLTVSTTFANLGVDAINIVQAGQSLKNLSFRGFADVNGIQIPINKSIITIG